MSGSMDLCGFHYGGGEKRNIFSHQTAGSVTPPPAATVSLNPSSANLLLCGGSVDSVSLRDGGWGRASLDVCF